MSNDPKILLDARGLVMHSMFRGDDPDALMNDDGKRVPTAAYGFAVFLETYLNELVTAYAPRQIIACWDDDSEYRNAIFPDYKKARRERDKDAILEAELEKLVKMVQKFLASIGAFQAKCKGVEADDLIALFATRLPGNKLIYTVDADLTQLAHSSDDPTEDAVHVLLRKELIEGDYKGTPCHLIPIYKALVGDSSDGYAGLKGFGAKAWANFIEAFGADGAEELQTAVAEDNRAMVEEAAAESDGIARKLLDKILAGWPDVRLMLDLATLHPELCDQAANYKVRKPTWYRRLPNAERALHILDELGCADHCEIYRKHLPTTTLITEANFSKLSEFVTLMSDGPFVAFDFESYDALDHEAFKQASKGRFVDVLAQKITGASFTAGANLQHTIYISVNHKDTANLPLSIIKRMLGEAEKRSTLVIHNTMFEIPVSMLNIGAGVIDEPIDTRLMASYVDENTSNSLKDLSLTLLGYKQDSYQETLDAAGAADMTEISGVDVLKYGADDAFCTAALADLFHLVMACEGTLDFFYKYERAPNAVLSQSLLDGWPIDFKLLDKMAKEDTQVIDTGMARIRELLAEHAAKPNEDAVDNYLTADHSYLALVCSERAEKNNGTHEHEWIKLRDKLLKQSVYRPLVSYRKPVDFKPTPAQVGKVLTQLGFETALASMAASRISEFVIQVRDTALDSRQDQFVELLAAASAEIKAREGAAYDAFAEFCEDVLAEGQPEVVEGDELNFGSPPQMQALMYLKLALPVRVRTFPQKGSKRDKNDMQGSPAANERAVALAMANDLAEGDWRIEVLDQFMAVKKAMTLHSLYYTPYPLWKRPEDGNVHGGFMNCGTVTRRPTGSSPNFLQVSKGKIRQAFSPADDRVVVSIDFNGQELRITASESRDPAMLDAYLGAQKKDIHSVTSCKIAQPVLQRFQPEAVARYIHDGQARYDEFVAIAKGDGSHPDFGLMSKVRKQAKTVNFLICYLGTAATLALKLGVPIEFAEQVMNAVFSAYARLDPWQQEVIEFARRHGYTQTAYGNRRHLSSALFSADKGERKRMERQAVNYVIQGCAADILKVVLTEVKRRGVLGNYHVEGMIPVYDEITASVPRAAAADYIAEMTEIMAITPPGHPVPMVPEVSIGPTWGQLIELGSEPTAEAIADALGRMDAATAVDEAEITREELEDDGDMEEAA